MLCKYNIVKINSIVNEKSVIIYKKYSINIYRLAKL